MATPGQISMVRTLAGELTDRSDYSDEQIEGWLAAGMSETEVAAQIWGFKAAKFATLVDVSESGSSRKMGDLYKNAIAMKANLLAEAAGVVGGGGGGSAVSRPRTRAIVRPNPS